MHVCMYTATNIRSVQHLANASFSHGRQAGRREKPDIPLPGWKISETTGKGICLET